MPRSLVDLLVVPARTLVVGFHPTTVRPGDSLALLLDEVDVYHRVVGLTFRLDGRDLGDLHDVRVRSVSAGVGELLVGGLQSAYLLSTEAGTLDGAHRFERTVLEPRSVIVLALANEGANVLHLRAYATVLVPDGPREKAS